MYVMFKDKVIAKFDFEKKEISFDKNASNFCFFIPDTIEGLCDWISKREPCLSSENQIILHNEYKRLNSTEHESFFNSMAFYATHPKDCYWIKEENSDLTWEQVNPRQNEFKDICRLNIELKSQTE